MRDLKKKEPTEIIHDLILPNNHFPNNEHYPLLIYKQVLDLEDATHEQVQHLLKQNKWINSWVNSIYDFDHYHSNTHETLVIVHGHCDVQIGGPGLKNYRVEKGDVIVFPAGVAHKNLGSSAVFKCIGAYPFDLEYDMFYGKPEEHPVVDQNIKRVQLPECDPIFGADGMLFDYWRGA